MAEHANVIRVAHFPVAGGQRQQLVSMLERFADRIRAMDGCFGIQICSVRESANEIAVVSRWASQSALDAFTSSGILDDPEVPKLLAGAARAEHFEPV